MKTKDRKTASKIYAMIRYYAQFVNDFHIKDNCLWMEDKLVVPNSLHTAINNRLHFYHHGKSNMFAAVKDIRYPYIHRNIASMAENCQECILVGKNLKPMCSKRNLGKIPEPKESNEAIQLNFWGPMNDLQESKKYVKVAVDRFSKWPSAMVCNTNRSDKILKFLKQYMNKDPRGPRDELYIVRSENVL